MSQLRKKRCKGVGPARRSTESTKQLSPPFSSLPTFVNVIGDKRFHAEVEIIGEKIVGLLDSDAQVSVVGPRFQS